MLPTTKVQERSLRATLDLVRDGIISTDLGGNVVQMNREAEVLTGWAEGETRGRPIAEAFKTVDGETGRDLEDPATRVLRGGSGTQRRRHVLLVGKDGTQRPIAIASSGTPLLGESDTLVGAALVFHHQAAEEAAYALVLEREATGTARQILLKSEKKYRILFETAKDA